jgi:Tfp pilus assembly protein PilW
MLRTRSEKTGTYGRNRREDGRNRREEGRNRREEGATLIEVLVTVSSGTVVLLALVAVLLFSTRQQTHLADVAQATQLGRQTMTKIADELHSACIAPSFTPIRQKSGGSELRFISAPSEEAVISKTAINEHRIVWNEKAETLTDEVYPATKEETWPAFTYASTPSKMVLIGSHIGQMESSGKKLPIFQYYGYSLEPSESSTAGVSTLSTTPLISGAETLNEEKAAKAASVLISFSTGSTASTTSLGGLGKDVSEPQQTQVTLSFSVPPSELENLDAPCQ